MNKNIVRAVAKRDLRSWFGNPTNYVFIMLFVAVSAFCMMWDARFFLNNLANLDTWTAAFPWIAVVFVSAATMGMWTSERANGTQELLFTLPANDSDLLIGKFLAYIGVWTAALLFTLPLPLTVAMLGSPDVGQMFANYVGFWLFGVMLVSVSMIGSQLTANATIAFIVSVIACAFVVYLGTVLNWLGFRSWATNGTAGQFAEFARGMIPLSGVLLFLGLTATFLYLNLALLARRHWRSTVEGGHGLARAAAFAVATLSLTIIAVYALPRFDTTSEGIHSLSAESKKLLANLDASKPIILKAYVSDDVPESLVQQRRLLLNLIDQFDSIGGNAVQKDIVIPAPFSPEARAAEANYGIRAQTVPVELPGGGYSEMPVFLGFVVTSGTQEVVTPFVEPGLPLEYEIARGVRVVSNQERRKIGVLKTDVEIVGGFDFQTFQQKQRWMIADELQQQYDVENVDPDKDYPDTIACLVVPQASSLAQEQLDRLQAWILAGKPTLLFEDPLPVSAPGTAADDQKGGMRANMMGGGGPQKGDFDRFYGSLGLRLPKTQIVWDSTSRAVFGGQYPPTFLFEGAAGMAGDSALTRGLQSIVMMIAGHIESTGAEGVNVTPLVSSPDPDRNDSMNGTIAKYESVPGRNDGYLVFDFLGRMQPNPNARFRPAPRRYDLVVRVGGKPKGSEHALNVICWSDLDAVSNTFFQIRRQVNVETEKNMRFDNVPLVLNCIDSLVGDESLIELRKRRPTLRRLTAVEKAQAEFERAWNVERQNAEDESDKALDAAKARLTETVDKIRNDKTLDAQSKENKIVEAETVENRRFETEKADIEAKKKERIERAQYDRDAARARIHNRYRVLAVLLAPIPALLLGVFTFTRRRARAQAIVPQNRQVGGGAA
jgi:ABC-2 type transport system permease protein